MPAGATPCSGRSAALLLHSAALSPAGCCWRTLPATACRLPSGSWSPPETLRGPAEALRFFHCSRQPAEQQHNNSSSRLCVSCLQQRDVVLPPPKTGPPRVMWCLRVLSSIQAHVCSYDGAVVSPPWCTQQRQQQRSPASQLPSPQRAQRCTSSAQVYGG